MNLVRHGHLAIRTLLLLCGLSSVAALGAQTVTLTSSASPATATPGVTTANVTGTGFPTGRIDASAVTVTLQPTSGAGPTATTQASAVVTVFGSTRRISFAIPVSLAVTSPTQYAISVAGTSAANVSFASGNTSAITLNPVAALLSVTPASGQAGQSVPVVLRAQLTHFAQGATQATFGKGISVGGGQPGGAGPVFVVGPTLAVAVVTVAPDAPAAANTVTVQTAGETISLSSAFTVSGAGTDSPGIVSLVSPATPDTALPGNTVTLYAANTPDAPLAAAQVNVLLEPATPGGGPTLATVATSIAGSGTGQRQIAFTVPSGFSPSSPIAYVVSVFGSTSDYGAQTTGFTFASGNKASLTIGQKAALVSVSPNSAAQGANVTVTVTGLGTNFTQGTTLFNFGTGVAVGGGQPGGFGPVTVQSATTATAQLRLDASAQPGVRTVQVATGAETAALVSGFTVQAAAPVPSLISVSPASGQQGQRVQVSLTGVNTSFGATSQVSFGTGITVEGVSATSGTGIVAQVAIAAAATLGARDVAVTTGAQNVSLRNAFTVLAAAVVPSIVSVSPSTGQQGQTVQLSITGTGTSFQPSSTSVTLGTGVTISGVVVNSATSLSVKATLASNAVAGARTLTVTTGAQVVTLAGAFTIQTMTATPVLVSVAPSSAQAGQTRAVTITGQNTSFGATTTVALGDGITVNSVSATSPTSLTVGITLAANAAAGARNLTVTTGSQTVTLANAFTVVAAGTGALVSISPNLGVAGAGITVTIVGHNTTFVQGSTQADFGASITVNSVVIADATHATVQIAVDSGAAVGSRDVRLTTNGVTALASGGFRVASPGPVVTISSPASQTLFNASPVTVTGTVSDPRAPVLVNGVAASVSGNAFTATNVPLAEAANTLVATATNSDGVTGSASVAVTLDTTPPTIAIDTPTSGAVVTSTSVTVSGMVNDIVSGTINAQQVTVSVNGLPATVSNRSFEIRNLLLVRGQNTVTAVATDRAGNKKSAVINVTVQSQAAQQTIAMISGNAQTGQIGTQLTAPLQVQLLDANSNPVASRAVTFTVRRSDGIVLTTGQSGQTVTLNTDAKGFAQVLFQLGTHVGAGMNQVQVTSPGFVGETIFCATSTSGQAVAIRSLAEITSVPVGVVGQPLTKPLQAIALDSGGNPVPNVPIVFTVQQGGGNLAGKNTYTGNTDSDGKVSVLFTLGMQEGVSNNVVTASLKNTPTETVSFQASGVVQGATAATTLSGVALDNSDVPIPHATATIVGTTLSTFTDDQGRFTLSGVPPGFVILKVDGATSTRPEKIPFLTYPLEIISGQANTIGKPALLPIIDTGSARTVGGSEDVVLTMKGVPGVAFTVAANSVTFPDGSHVGPMTLSQVHSDKVPHAPPYGTVPKVVWTVQPAGTLFNPPIKVQLPNTDNLSPGQVLEVFQIDHDLHQFVSIGMARVSADGSVLVTDNGFGITKAGWGVPAPPPPPKKCVGGCGDCKTCQDGACVVANEGGSCDDKNDCTTNDKCKSGACKGDPVMITKVNGMCVAAKGTAASFTAEANDTSHIKWAAPAGMPAMGMGASFSTTFNTEGSTVVTAMCMSSSQSKMVTVAVDCSTIMPMLAEEEVVQAPDGGNFGQVHRLSHSGVYKGCAAGGKWCFRLDMFKEKHGVGTSSNGDTAVTGPNDAVVTPATCAAIIADLTPPAANAGMGPNRSSYWSPSITLAHEHFHVSDFRSKVVMPTMTSLAAFVAMNANCTDCKTDPPASFDMQTETLWNANLPTYFDGNHEVRAHNFSNPMYATLIAGIRARAASAPAAQHWPAACK